MRGNHLRRHSGTRAARARNPQPRNSVGTRSWAAAPLTTRDSGYGFRARCSASPRNDSVRGHRESITTVSGCNSGIQIDPAWILFFDQPGLPVAPPTLRFPSKDASPHPDPLPSRAGRGRRKQRCATPGHVAADNRWPHLSPQRGERSDCAAIRVRGDARQPPPSSFRDARSAGPESITTKFSWDASWAAAPLTTRDSGYVGVDGPQRHQCARMRFL
jgi:hypothetical protein